MSDVDSIRWLASEHDLEFVDLDTYGVDPAAEKFSRRRWPDVTMSWPSSANSGLRWWQRPTLTTS